MDSQSINTLFREIIISSNNEYVFIRDLSDPTLQLVFKVWWASMCRGSKHPICWNHARHGPSWWLYLHSGIEETGSCGILCIVCRHVLRHAPDCRTTSMGKHLLPTAHIPKLNESIVVEVSELTSTTINETAWARVQRQGSRGNRIVSFQKKFIFNSWILPILIQLTATVLWFCSKGLPNCRISPRYPESLAYVRMCFGSHCMECYIKPWATMGI